jgi:hypothetical protein
MCPCPGLCDDIWHQVICLIIVNDQPVIVTIIVMVIVMVRVQSLVPLLTSAPLIIIIIILVFILVVTVRISGPDPCLSREAGCGVGKYMWMCVGA